MIEILGIIKDPPVEAVFDNGVVGATITPEVEREGWHAIVLAADLTAEMEPYVDTSGPVHRVFYGLAGDTVALKFPDEATGHAVLGLD